MSAKVSVDTVGSDSTAVAMYLAQGTTVISLIK